MTTTEIDWVPIAANCVLGGQATCVEYERCDDGSVLVNWHGYIDGVQVAFVPGGCESTPPQGPQQITIAMVLEAFKRLPVPASELTIQPPNGRTLVNLETNFYTVNDPFERSITLLGQQVDFQIRATTFTWNHGDGTTQNTTTPGAAYPDLQITHTYQTAGTLNPSVDTTYTADYRVNTGPWAPVPGTVTIPGTPVTLDVVTATPQLVG